MPEFTGRLRITRLTDPPANPQEGEVYFNTTEHLLRLWDGTNWRAATIYDTDQIGTVKSYSGTVVPNNWMLADGRSLSRASYPDLFAAIGTAYGAPDGATFRLPDLRSRFIYGASDPTAQGANGGEATHLLTTTEMPSHSHGGATGTDSPDHSHSIAPNAVSSPGQVGAPGSQYIVGSTVTSGTGGASARHTHSISPQGGDGAHNNLPPYVLIAQIIKVTGVQVDVGGALVGPAGANGAVSQVQSAGTPLPVRPALNFLAGAIDDANNNRTNIVIPLVGLLPSSPVDGMEVYYQADATNGAIWHLRYRAAAPAPYRWECVGKGTLIKEYNQQESFAGFSPNAWGSVSANDPGLTAPLSGEYVMRATAQLVPSLTCSAYMGVRVGTTDPDANQGPNCNCVLSYWPSGMQTGAQVLSMTRRITLAAGTVLQMRERHNAASAITLYCGPKALELEPIRVG